MAIETQRLELTLLSPRELRLFAEDLPALERELRCRYLAEPLEGHFLDILRGQAAIAEREPRNAFWHSFFLLLRKEDRAVVGSADFKRPPDESGAVEIGYGLGNDFEHQGYMTEAVNALCAAAFAREGVRRVTAETEAWNLASQRVLRRCGFALESRAQTLWWALLP